MIEKSTNSNNQLFSRDQLKTDLKRKSVHGALNKVVTAGSSTLLTLASAMILARLLAPEIFGLFAMVLSITEIARYMMEIGLGTATVQKENITQEEVSALFWINVTIGLVLALAVAVVSPAVAWFYGNTKLVNICLVLSLTFLFRGIVVQHRALLERQMRFGYLGIINITSNFSSYAAAIFLAYNGFGVWALVWREIVFVTLYAVGIWLFCRWMPGLPKLQANVRSSLSFGVDLSGVSFIQYLTQNLDKILIGRFCGASSLGLYTKASQLAMMPIENIRMIFWDIGLSPLSALQSDEERYRNFYGRLLAIQSLLYLPIVMFIAIQAEDVIRLLLGEVWVSAAPILRIFAVAGFVTPIVATFQLVMVSCGKTRRYLTWGIINGSFMILSYVSGIRWGVIGVAYAYTCASYLLLVLALRYCLKDTPINTIFVIKNISTAILSCFGAGAILVGLLPQLPNLSTLINIIYSFAVFLLVYLALLLCIPKGRQQLAEFWSYRKELLPKV
jgi:O-antigen/teichoic acid export membrane protein